MAPDVPTSWWVWDGIIPPSLECEQNQWLGFLSTAEVMEHHSHELAPLDSNFSCTSRPMLMFCLAALDTVFCHLERATWQRTEGSLQPADSRGPKPSNLIFYKGLDTASNYMSLEICPPWVKFQMKSQAQIKPWWVLLRKPEAGDQVEICLDSCPTEYMLPSVTTVFDNLLFSNR